MKLRFREDGPIVIDLPEGTRFALDSEEHVLERPKLALCRCGGSQNKPFCDGTHKRNGFRAPAGLLEVED
ncbi:CDGSH iron-sulfur domain-containing protein [Oceanithermus sp.]